MPLPDPTPPRVLVVDDDPASLYATGRLMTGAGYQVLPFASPIDARAYVESHPVDLVVSDYWMREMNGAQLHASVRATLGARTPPFILITAMIAPIPGSQRIRFAAVLEKPFPFASLDRMVRAVLEAKHAEVSGDGA